MKKLLFGTTALVGAFALAGSISSAQAQTISVGGALDVTVSGTSEFEIEFLDEDFGGTSADPNREWFFNQDHEIQFEAIGVADATGITYGLNLQIEEGGNGDNAGFDEAYSFIEGSFGRFEFGNEDGVADTLFIGTRSIVQGTGGVDGAQRTVFGPTMFDSNEATKVTYFTPFVAGFQAGVSYAFDKGDFGDTTGPDNITDLLEVAANYQGTFSMVDVGAFAGATFADGSDLDIDGDGTSDGGTGVAWSVGGMLGIYGFDFGVLWADEAEDDGVAELAGFYNIPGETNVARDTLFNVGVGTEVAGVGVGFNYQRDWFEATGGDPTQDQFILSADTGILPGVSLEGDVAYVERDSDGLGDDTDGVNAVIQLDVNF